MRCSMGSDARPAKRQRQPAQSTQRAGESLKGGGSERRLITFITFVEADPARHPPFTAEAANHLNTSVLLPTFTVLAAEPGRLYADHVLTYADGIIDSHLVCLLRRFAGAVRHGAHMLDEPVLH